MSADPDTVADPRQRGSAEDEEEAASAANQAAKALGGLMNRMRKKPAEEPAKDAKETKPASAKTKGGKMLFTSNTELLSASGNAAAADVALPAGFKLVKK